MMAVVKLGEIEFESQVYSKQIDWENQFTYSRVQTVTEFDWNGALAVWQNQTSGGRPIHLVAGEDEAFLNQAQVDAIHTMFNTLGATYPFHHNDKIYQVIIREFNPTRLKGFFDDDGLQLHTATIDLIEVF